MKIGKFTLTAIDTCTFSLDGGAMFGVIPKVLWSKAYHPGDELSRIPLAARLLLVQWDNHNLLIDTGNGTKLSDKLCKIYNIDKEKASVETALSKLNINTEAISEVILTHLHFDHAGGATKYDNGKPVPTFPNAKYYVQKEQFEWAKAPSVKDRASFMPENFMPLQTAGQLELVDGEAELFPGISVIPLYGHTAGMQLVKISDGGETLLYCADLFPTAAHIPIPYVMAYDNYPMTTIEEKKKILPQAYEEKWTLFFEHDVFTQTGKVQSNERGFSVIRD
jgi:glyoxylase-like metal-dependent hydrolase (beta-lactamase superfamily II)